MSFSFDEVRSEFPALSRTMDGKLVAYLDGPAGSQVPRVVADAVHDYLLGHNANSHGVFATSRETDAMLEAAQQAALDFVGDGVVRKIRRGSVAFGANMTSLTFAFSRALSRTWRAGDEVLVTRLDHDANVSPWVLAARDAGATVRHVEINPDDCTLDLEDLSAKLSDRTRLVAVGGASNSVGTLNPIEKIAWMAHAFGAEVFVDAVHLAPHVSLNVELWDCDYLACSAYKFFGPHVGLLWGKRERLAELEAYKVRPAPDELPDKWMTGTQNHEGIAGVLAAIEYLGNIGRRVSVKEEQAPLAEALRGAFREIGRYERELSRRLLAGLAELPSIKVWGIIDPARLAERVPTFSITHRRLAPQALAEALARQAIFVWHGNYYALALSEALGREPEGMVRIGLLHYNTAEEVDRLLGALAELES